MKLHIYKKLAPTLAAIIATNLLAGCGGGEVIREEQSVAREVASPAPLVKLEFYVNQSRNNQGLAYSNGYYYVGYDVGGGNGYIERYTLDGRLDGAYGGVSVPTRHTAELAFRSADGRIYAASGGGTNPAYVYRLAPDGRSVDYTYDFTAYGNSALLAIDNKADLLILFSTQTGGDFGNPTFRFIDWNNSNRIVSQFTIPFEGVPQGLDVYDGIIYYYTDNKIILLDYGGNVLERWHLNISGESEGLTLVQDGGAPYLAIGYNGSRRIYTVRPAKLGSSPIPFNSTVSQ